MRFVSLSLFQSSQPLVSCRGLSAVATKGPQLDLLPWVTSSLLINSYFPKTFMEHLLGARCLLGTENSVKLLICKPQSNFLLKKPLSGVFQ